MILDLILEARLAAVQTSGTADLALEIGLEAYEDLLTEAAALFRDALRTAGPERVLGMRLVLDPLTEGWRVTTEAHLSMRGVAQ